MNPMTTGLIGILIFFLLIALKMPIAYAMALVGFIGFAYLTTLPAAFALVSTELFSSFANYSLSVIPMFIWMGFLAYHAGIGARRGAGDCHAGNLCPFWRCLWFQHGNGGNHWGNCLTGDG